MTITATIVKEQLHRIPTKSGSPLILGIFKATLAGTYATGGFEVDLSTYMKQIVAMSVVKGADVAGGLNFDVDDAKFATGMADVEVNAAPTSPDGATIDVELTATTSLEGHVLRLIALGLG